MKPLVSDLVCSAEDASCHEGATYSDGVVASTSLMQRDLDGRHSVESFPLVQKHVLDRDEAVAVRNNTDVTALAMNASMTLASLAHGLNQSIIHAPLATHGSGSVSTALLHVYEVAHSGNFDVASITASSTSSGVYIVSFLLVAVVICVMGVCSFAQSYQEDKGHFNGDNNSAPRSQHDRGREARPLLAPRAASQLSQPAPAPASVQQHSTAMDPPLRSCPKNFAAVPASTALSETPMKGESNQRASAPEFVVPRGRACYLVVRPVPSTGVTGWMQQSPVKIDVLDLKGTPMLEGQVKRPVVWRRECNDPISNATTPPAVMLHMLHSPGATTVNSPGAPRSSLVAMCYASVSQEGERMMLLYDSTGMAFGKLSLDSSQRRYELCNPNDSSKIVFEGDFRQYTAKITSHRQEKVATVEPCTMAMDPDGKFYRLRISSGSDVSLIVKLLCSLMSIEEMETAAFAQDAAAGC